MSRLSCSLKAPHKVKRKPYSCNNCMSRAFYTKAYTKANDTVVPQAQMLSYHMHECVCRNSPSSQAGTLMVGAWSWTLIGTNPVASIVGARTVPLIVP